MKKFFVPPPLLPALFALLASHALRSAPGQVFPPLTDAEVAAVEAALPEKALVAPAQPRRLLVFYRTEGFVHASIPVGRLAIQRLGEKTGAYASVASDDMAMFEPETLGGFDAVVFLNSTGLRFENPVHRKALLDLVRSGKGVAGLHAATDNFPTWPEGQALMGGVFHGHPWGANDVCAVKNDEPAHVVNAGFGGQGFWIREEIYQMGAPYSRERQRVLLSLDMSKPENARPAKNIRRTDNDFAISWVRTEDKGRVFYTSLGHNSDIYFTPAILRHVLDGLQFALGDLAADATPSARLDPAPKPVLAPAVKATLQELTPKPPAEATPSGETALRAALADPGATEESLRIALDQARLIGAAGAVPEIEKLAVRPGFAERAIVVLAALREPAAGAALLRLSKTLPEGRRSPALQALAAYPGREAVIRLAEAAAGTDAADAAAARETLAALGRHDAFAALAALPASTETTRALISAASLLPARDRAGVKAAVEKLQSLVAEPALETSLRVEALNTLAKLDRAAALAAADPLLEIQDRRVRQAAATLLAGNLTPARAESLAKEWAGLPVDVRVALLAATERTEILRLARPAIASDDPLVYEAGVRAALRAGDTDTLLALLPCLAEKGRARDLARGALASSDAPGLTERLRALAAKGDPASPLPALIGLLGDRADRESLPIVMAACASDSDELRASAFAALAVLTAPGDLPAVLALAPKARKSADRRDWRKALFNSAATHPSGGEAAILLLARLNAAGVDERTAIIGALTLVEASEARNALAGMLAAADVESRKSVLRALSAARGRESLDMLMTFAAGSAAEGERILAIRGCIETIPNLESTTNNTRVDLFRKVWPLAFRQEEKDAILAAVRQYKEKSAIKFVEEFTPREPVQKPENKQSI